MSGGENAGEYENRNPYTSDAMSAIQGYEQRLEDFEGHDPDAYFNEFMNQAPELQGLVSGAMSGLEQDIDARTDRLMDRSIGEVSDQFSGLGGVHSSAARSAAGAQAAQHAQDAAVQLGGRQLDLTGQLWSQGMQQAQQAQQFGTEMDMQRIQGFGQHAQALAGMGQPMMEYNPTGWERYGQPLAEAGVGAGIGFLAGGPAGAAVGAGSGLMDLIGGRGGQNNVSPLAQRGPS